MTVMDHWFQMLQAGGPFEPMLEAYTSLGYLAGVTKNVRLSVLVTGVTYRYPGLLAKTVTTLDVLTRGRAMLGIGAAGTTVSTRRWACRSPRPASGSSAGGGPADLPADVVGQRRRLRGQALSARGDDQPAPAAAWPGAIMIGGGGEQKTLRMVAQYAQACNLFAAAGDEGLETVKHKLDVLRGHCERLGTDYDAIEKTMQYRGATLDDVDGFLAEMQKYKALGINLVSFAPALYTDPVPWVTDVVEKIVPRLKEV